MNKSKSNQWYKNLLFWLVVFAVIMIAIVAFAKSIGLIADISVDLGPASIHIQPDKTEIINSSQATQIKQDAIIPTQGSIQQPNGSQNDRCLIDSQSFAMQYNLPYGPYNNYTITRTFSDFIVTDSHQNQITYPLPQPAFWNSWQSLNGAPFDICVDNYGGYVRPHS